MSNCESSSCGCGPTTGRRDFLRVLSAGATAAALPAGTQVMAGPFTQKDLSKHLIPADKKLDAAWVASLTQRGQAEVFPGEQLKYIGMPVGGIGCGQLYLGGDGKLWLWDIFKSNYRREPDHGQRIAAFTLGGHYAHPVAQGEEYTRWNGADVQQGFLVRTKAGTRTLDRQGFPGVTFRGEYPIGRVTYAEKGFPVKVKLEAFSPFIPLNAKDSALPATVMSFAVTNTTEKPLEVDLCGWMQNATCPYEQDASLGQRRNRVVQTDNRVSLLSTVEPTAAPVKGRDDVVFADFEGDDWGEWTAEGDAFAGGPFPIKSLAYYQKVTGHTGGGFVNSLNTRKAPKPGPDDALTGTLTSPEFTVARNFIALSVGGGRRSPDTYVEVLVEGKQVAKVQGRDSSSLFKESINMSAHQGKKAVIRIVDQAKGGWAHVTADQVVFTDAASAGSGDIESKHGFGSMALTLLHRDEEVSITAASSLADPASPEKLFDQLEAVEKQGQAVKPLNELLVGGLSAGVTLAPGESKTIDFAVTWYFPDYNEIDAAPGNLSRTRNFRNLRRHYAPWFKSAGEVAGYLAGDKKRLLGDTREWNRTWYDSTLPYWLLDRSFIPLDCVASQMFHWFDNGRPYGWEGVDCCPGTCTHVWHYAQALGRVFPELERAFREKVDFKAGVGFNADSGMINDRGDFHRHEATDGQAGTILRVYREHLMSKDDAFLRRLWPNIRKAVEFLIAKDPDANGLIEGRQPHTLDAAWFGPMGWISGLYLAALRAGEAMATEMGDTAFAEKCRSIADKGRGNIVSELFDGEYFIHKADPKRRALQSGKGCHIDQVLGQAWAHQVGLERVIPEKETVSALESLWRYNFAPDAGDYAMRHREIEKAFRWYAMPGEAGLLMCTWPKGGALDAIPGQGLRPVENPEKWTGPGGYFNECMNGFEYQVAAHMVYEGEPGSELVEKGLAITRAIHDRYAAGKRNPYNEIECGDHYARSMAGYGVYLGACGYQYHGPKGELSFAPRLQSENFKAAFTAAEGWGSYSQTIAGGQMQARVRLLYGRLRLRVLSLVTGGEANAVKVVLGDETLPAALKAENGRVMVEFRDDVLLEAGQRLEVSLT